MELLKVKQNLSFGKMLNFALVPSSEFLLLTAKIADYRGNHYFHVKIDKILGNKLIHHHDCNDL